MLSSSFTVASVLLLFTAIPLEASFNQTDYGDLYPTIPLFNNKASGSSLLCNNWLDVLRSSTQLEEARLQDSSFTKVRVTVTNSIYGYSNCSFYTEAKMLHYDKVHSAMNLADQTISNTTKVIGYEPFGFSGTSLADQEDGACSDIGSIPRGIDYSLAKEAETIANITLFSMYVLFTMRFGVTGGIPNMSSLILSLSVLGNTSSATQPYFLHNHRKHSAYSLVEVGTPDNLVDYIESSGTYHTHRKVFHTHFTLGLSLCCFVVVITGIYSSVKSQQLRKHKSKAFQKNGGLLLQQHFSASTSRGSTPIFTFKELEKTMQHCHRKSHTFGPAEDYEVRLFVNDIITLTQINHQNVVKFFGCCLETESPILVYELVSNGTLFDYIHHRNKRSLFPWDTLLKIASESAAAIAYLHSASIIHGNVKSSNILLTDCFMAKVVGFGPSRLVPSDETQACTLFQRTLGYLDPEYLHKGQLTYKSDVYSFGMVLLEIVTGERPISFGRPESQRIMASHFVFSMELQSILLDQNVGNLGIQVKEEQVRAVAELAKRCLSLSSSERPAMDEVARELTMLRS